MDDDIQKAIDQVVAQTEQDERKAAIEAYIQDVVAMTRANIKSNLFISTVGMPEPARREIETWAEMNKARFALKATEVISILLRKELLGE
jgi:hypothetical protein